jgi:hypothetical protein
MLRLTVSAIAVSFALAGVTGCKSFIQKSAMDTTADVLYRAKAASQQESDIELARLAIPGALKTVEGFHVANPPNKRVIEMLMEGYCSYATGFLEDEFEVAKLENRHEDAETARKRASGLYLRCVNYAVKLLPDSWNKAFFGDLETFEKTLARTDRKHIKALFWAGVGLAGSINVNRDDIALIAHLPKAKMIMEKVIAWNPEFQYGIPLMALAAMNSAQGEAIGGNPARAKELFDKAIAVSEGKFLMVKVMQAKTYAVINQDRELFRKLLTEVLTTSPAVMPEQRLANELAHHKAKRYLKQESDWF